MATSEENDLIGYDPLAWMEDSADKNEDNLATDEIDSANEQDEQGLIDNEISADDYSDNLEEENAILSGTEEDDLVVNENEVESDSALIEEAADDGMDTEDMETEVAVDDAISVEEHDSLVDLDATLTIQNVVKLHEKLKNVLAIHDEIEINASDVSSIDTATLQLLVSLKKDAVKLQKKVDIIYPSPRFVESAKLLGLLDVLEVHDA